MSTGELGVSLEGSDTSGIGVGCELRRETLLALLPKNAKSVNHVAGSKRQPCSRPVMARPEARIDGGAAACPTIFFSAGWSWGHVVRSHYLEGFAEYREDLVVVDVDLEEAGVVAGGCA